MCGIVGIVGTRYKDERDAVIQRMNNDIKHRGPDDSGLYADDYCTLEMRRLSIIDLKSGKQPIYNNRHNKLVFFNGEIYNYKELRVFLQKKGYVFITNSDTECIIHLYDEYGENCVDHLNGPFVFCIYEIDSHKIFIARDRFGEKPFFYFHQDGYFTFSSEIKSLMNNPHIPRKLNYEALPYYLKCSQVPQPNTLLKDIYSLPPGNTLVYHKNKLIITPHFNIIYKQDNSIKNINDAIDLIKPLFIRSVERQIRSDVPIGAFLSGGVDSSTIVSQMQSLLSKPIRTFNVRFEEASYDESKIAREVAAKFNTEHHEFFIPNAGFNEEVFWAVISHVGVPFSDSSAIPMWFISKEIKKYVTVALSGEGGDELFGGYNLFSWYDKICRVKKVPMFMRSAFINTLHSIKKVISSDLLRKYERAFLLSDFDNKDLAIEIHELFNNKEIHEIIPDATLKYSKLKNYPAEYNKWSNLRKIMYYRIKYNLHLDMLTKVDSMSMANSLEIRSPFLDVDLFEASCLLPDKFLRKGGKGKLVIREMVKNELPASVFNHPKSGFSIPLHKYQNDVFGKLCDKLFNDDMRINKIIPFEMLQNIKRSGLNTLRSNSETSVYKSSHKLWAILQLSGWLEFFDIQL